MSFAIRRKVLYWIAAAALALMLVGTTVTTTPVLADCNTTTAPNCSG